VAVQKSFARKPSKHVALATAYSAMTAVPSNEIRVTRLFVTIVDLSILVNSVRLHTVETVLMSYAVVGVVHLAVKSAAVVVVSVPCAMKSLPKRQKLVSERIICFNSRYP
jgi:hypothetical protein